MSQTTEWMNRYSRQILLPQIGGIGQKKLEAGRVALIGTGVVARTLLLYGVGAGIGDWTLLEHNAADAKGRHGSVQSLIRHSKLQNPTVVVQPWSGSDNRPECLYEFLNAQHFNLVLATSADPPQKKRLISTCRREKIPLLLAISRGQFGWIVANPCPTCFDGPPPLSTGETHGPDNPMIYNLLGTLLAQKALQILLEQSAQTAFHSWMSGFCAETSRYFVPPPQPNADCPDCLRTTAESRIIAHA
ncbi:MAG: hypothetical protein HQL67_09430 [Magnetococcales bacterium]|nr:hypothetical protein [Magnetococcales bacterium]